MKKFFTIFLLVVIVIGSRLVCLAFLLGFWRRCKSRTAE